MSTKSIPLTSYQIRLLAVLALINFCQLCRSPGLRPVDSTLARSSSCYRRPARLVANFSPRRPGRRQHTFRLLSRSFQPQGHHRHWHPVVEHGNVRRRPGLHFSFFPDRAGHGRPRGSRLRSCRAIHDFRRFSAGTPRLRAIHLRFGDVTRRSRRPGARWHHRATLRLGGRPVHRRVRGNCSRHRSFLDRRTAPRPPL